MQSNRVNSKNDNKLTLETIKRDSGSYEFFKKAYDKRNELIMNDKDIKNSGSLEISFDDEIYKLIIAITYNNIEKYRRKKYDNKLIVEQIPLGIQGNIPHMEDIQSILMNQEIINFLEKGLISLVNYILKDTNEKKIKDYIDSEQTISVDIDNAVKNNIVYIFILYYLYLLLIENIKNDIKKTTHFTNYITIKKMIMEKYKLEEKDYDEIKNEVQKIIKNHSQLKKDNNLFSYSKNITDHKLIKKKNIIDYINNLKKELKQRTRNDYNFSRIKLLMNQQEIKSEIVKLNLNMYDVFLHTFKSSINEKINKYKINNSNNYVNHKSYKKAYNKINKKISKKKQVMFRNEPEVKLIPHKENIIEYNPENNEGNVNNVNNLKTQNPTKSNETKKTKKRDKRIKRMFKKTRNSFKRFMSKLNRRKKRKYKSMENTQQ